MSKRIIIEPETYLLKDVIADRYLTMREFTFRRVLTRIRGLLELYPKYEQQTKDLIATEIKHEINYIIEEFGYEYDLMEGLKLKVVDYEPKKE